MIDDLQSPVESNRKKRKMRWLIRQDVMGLSIRIFFFPQSETCRPIPLARFRRFWNGSQADAFPEYAGRRLKMAEVIVQLEKRQPVEILRLNCSILQLDHLGAVDRSEVEKEIRLALKALPPVGRRLRENIVEASSIFYKKQFEEKYSWKPSTEQLAQIQKHIFASVS